MSKHLSIASAVRFRYWAERRWTCLDHLAGGELLTVGIIDAGYCLDNGSAA